MLNLTKPLQIKIYDKWVDCELGKCHKDNYGVYVKEERSVEFGGDKYTHYWTCLESLRNKPRKFTKTFWLRLYDDGFASIKCDRPTDRERGDLQIREIEVEWEF